MRKISPLAKTLARKIGGKPIDIQKQLEELIEHGILAVNDEGYLYSPRMVREARRVVRRAR